jgi:pimeloyl-ACP methyl ester carboxylesterase
MKILKIIFGLLLTVFVMMSIIPYLVPLTRPNEIHYKPFENSNFIVVEDVQIHYRIYHSANKAPTGKLLMVHGLGGSTYSFEKNAQVIADEGYIVLLVDLPGFGYSQRLETFDHSQENRSEVLWSLLDTMDSAFSEEIRSKKWHLAGHSMGGGTVAAMAVLYPQNTESLILIDAALNETNRQSVLFKYPPATRWLQVALERILIRQDFISDFLSSAYGRQPSMEEVTGYLKPLELSGTARSFKGFLRTSRNMEIERIQDIELPVFIVWGEEDLWIPIDEAYKTDDLFDNSKLVTIEKSGHCPMETHPMQFNTFLMNWLSDLN